MTSALNISIALHLPVSKRWVVALTFGRGWWKVEGFCQPYLRQVCVEEQLWYPYPCGSRTERYRTMRSTLFRFKLSHKRGLQGLQVLRSALEFLVGVVMGGCVLVG